MVLGRKGKTHTIEIAFRADNFYHLAGLHKLKQRYPFQQQTSKWVLDHILRGTISVSSFSKDQNFIKLKSGCMLCAFLKKYWIVTKRNSFCMIEGKYLLPLKLWQIIWQRDT